MCATNKTWSIRQPCPELCKKIARSLNISPLVSQILINRGIDTTEQADLFLSAKLRDLRSPFIMKDMDKAVERVIRALKNKEKICIYGDYDVDGITATSIMVIFLKQIRADVTYYIPSRLNEGYSLHIDSLQKIKKTGVSLIITVDCGVSDVA